MADNQHMRNQYRADTEEKEDDPLAELSRIVGFDDDEEVSADSAGEQDVPEFSFDLESELFGDIKDEEDSDAGHVASGLNPEPSVIADADEVQIDIEETIAAALLTNNSEAVFTDEDAPADLEVDGPVAEQPETDSDFAELVSSLGTSAWNTEADLDPVEPDVEAFEQEMDAELSGETEDEDGLPNDDNEDQTLRSVDERAASPGGSDRTGDLPGVDFDALFAGGINDGEADSEAEDDNSLERTSHLREELVRDIEEQSGLGNLMRDDRGAASAAQTWNSKGDMNRPPDDTKAGGEPESEFWPNAKKEKNEEILSLEAELQAAFDALEGKSASGSSVQNEPVTTAVPFAASAASYSPQTQPDDGATFSAALEQLQNAGRKSGEQPQAPPAEHGPQFSQEPEAPQMPVASNLADTEPQSGDDGEMPLGDLLAAEMAAIENLAAEATSERVSDIPFNPADIFEDDSVPDDMGAVEVPDQQGEEPKASVALDEDLNISLEDELAALSAEAQDHGYVQTDLHSEEEYYAEHADPAVAAELAAHASALSHDFGSHEARLDEEAAVPDWDDQSLDDDDTAAVADIEYEAEEDARQDWQPDEQEFDAGFAAVDFSDIEEAPESNRSGRTLYTLLAAVIAIVLVSGAGLYFWNSSIGEDGAGGEPPIITAETDPVKIKPDDPGGTTVPNQDLAVYDRVSGTGNRTPRQENLVSTEEEPVDIVQRTLDPDTLPLEGRNEAQAIGGTKAEDRLVAGESIDPDPAASTGDSIGITPKRVRTLIVKPDGTIVSREQEPGTVEFGMTATNGAVSGDMPVTTKAGPETALATGEPETVVAAAAETGTGAVTANANGGPSAGTASTLPPIEENLRDSGELPVPVGRPTETTGATATAEVQADGAAAESANATNLRSSIAVPVPTPRPADQPVNIVEAVTDRGNLAGSTRTAGAGGYMVQISSQVTEEGARSDYQRQARQFASVIGGYGVDIQKADIPGRGVFYRVRIPAGSKQAATDLCERLKAAGGNCFVAR